MAPPRAEDLRGTGFPRALAKVEALFYQTYAQRLRALGACCPELLLLDRSDRALTLAISRLRGEAVRKLSPTATDQALQWLARLHAEFWGVRAETECWSDGSASHLRASVGPAGSNLQQESAIAFCAGADDLCCDSVFRIAQNEALLPIDCVRAASGIVSQGSDSGRNSTASSRRQQSRIQILTTSSH